MRSGLTARTLRSGFTLIEIMVVLGIIGLMAAMVVPKISFYYEPPSVLLRRSVEEASNLALSGVSVRFVLKPGKGHKRGAVTAEALVKAEDPRNPGKKTLEWRPVKLGYPMAGSGWRMDPEIVYFYTDGSCTPARVSWSDDPDDAGGADRFFLTVTGYCAEMPEGRR